MIINTHNIQCINAYGDSGIRMMYQNKQIWPYNNSIIDGINDITDDAVPVGFWSDRFMRNTLVAFADNRTLDYRLVFFENPYILHTLMITDDTVGDRDHFCTVSYNKVDGLRDIHIVGNSLNNGGYYGNLISCILDGRYYVSVLKDNGLIEVIPTDTVIKPNEKSTFGWWYDGKNYGYGKYSKNNVSSSTKYKVTKLNIALTFPLHVVEEFATEKFYGSGTISYYDRQISNIRYNIPWIRALKNGSGSIIEYRICFGTINSLFLSPTSPKITHNYDLQFKDVDNVIHREYYSYCPGSFINFNSKTDLDNYIAVRGLTLFHKDFDYDKITW